MFKRDEMEQSIYDKSARITWQIIITALFIFGLYQTFTEGGSKVYIFIASLSILLQVFLERFYFSKVRDRMKFIKYAGTVLLILFIIIFAMIWMAR